MTLAGYVFDAVAYAPIPNASLSIADANGSPIGGGVSADAQGLFNISSPQLDSGAKLLVSSVGYTPVLADPAVIAASGAIGLTPAPQTLQAAVVTFSKSSTGKYLLYGAGGALVLWAVWPKKKRRGRMGDNGGMDWTKIIIPGAIAAGLILGGKALLQKLGIISTPSPQQQATAQAQATSLAQAQQQAAAAGQQPSYTTDQYTGWANDIYNITHGKVLPIDSATQDQVVSDIINVNTMLDLQLLISAFGQRSGNCAFLGLGCETLDLEGWVKIVLDSDHLNKLNQYLADTGINYVF